MPSWGLLSQFWIQQQILSSSESMLWIKENKFCLCHPVTPDLAPAKIFFQPCSPPRRISAALLLLAGPDAMSHLTFLSMNARSFATSLTNHIIASLNSFC